MIYDGLKQVSKQEYDSFIESYPFPLYRNISQGFIDHSELGIGKIVAVFSIDAPEGEWWILADNHMDGNKGERNNS